MVEKEKGVGSERTRWGGVRQKRQVCFPTTLTQEQTYHLRRSKRVRREKEENCIGKKELHDVVWLMIARNEFSIGRGNGFMSSRCSIKTEKVRFLAGTSRIPLIVHLESFNTRVKMVRFSTAPVRIQPGSTPLDSAKLQPCCQRKRDGWFAF
jgi:hypothetical protein